MGLLWNLYTQTDRFHGSGGTDMQHLVITISRQYGSGGRQNSLVLLSTTAAPSTALHMKVD